VSKLKTKRLTDLKLNEVSLCAQGMNKNAKVTLFKSSGDAQTITEVIADRIKEKSLADRFTQVWDLTYALQESISSIIEDDAVTDKQKMLDETLSQFSGAMAEVIPTLVPTLNKGEAKMNIEELQKSLEGTQTQVAELTKQNQTLASELEVFKGMSGREKAYYDTLDAGMKKKFAGQTAAERKATMDGANFQKSEPTEEELLKALPESVRKMVEESKAQAAEALAKAQAAEDARERSELISKAEKEYGNVPGKPEEKAAILKHLKTAPDEVRASIEAIFKQFGALVSRGFIEKGHGHDVDPASADEQLKKMAEDVSVKKSITFAAAYDEVIQTPKGQQLYKEHRQTTRSKAA
jgi:hypothetical protein